MGDGFSFPHQSEFFTLSCMSQWRAIIYFREIPVSPFYKMEDIAMSINNDPAGNERWSFIRVFKYYH